MGNDRHANAFDSMEPDKDETITALRMALAEKSAEIGRLRAKEQRSCLHISRQHIQNGWNCPECNASFIATTV
jgi:hypothetical protein